MVVPISYSPGPGLYLWSFGSYLGLPYIDYELLVNFTLCYLDDNCSYVVGPGVSLTIICPCFIDRPNRVPILVIAFDLIL